MDRVSRSYLNDFKKSNGYEDINDETLAFEHFVNYTITEPKSEYFLDIEALNIGTNGTIGIDGFALLIDKQLINTIEELEDYLNDNKKSSAEIVFIQAKTSPKFDSKEVNNFGFAVSDFISEEPKLSWSDIAKEKIDLFTAFISRISELNENPICSLYYVSLGRNEGDTNISTIINSNKETILNENIFSKVSFELVGAVDLQKKYKKINQINEKSFEFPQRLTLPIIDGINESYIGTISALSIIDLMTDDNNEIMHNVFYDNVRDFQGSNKVNLEIEETIKSDYKDAFLVLNNGITIVAETLKTTRDNFKISNYQIINGCQTSHVIYENLNIVDDSIKVPIKLIISADDKITSKIIRSTNRQTEVKEQDLIAFSQFQKNLEDYYKTFSGDDLLYYERRSKQYNSKPVDRKKIIDKTTQIKAIASLFFDKPNLATRYFGALFTELGEKLFKDNHKMYPYYLAAFGFYKIDNLFRSHQIDKKYKKIKYHLLMMFKYEVTDMCCPPFESKKSELYCQKLYDTICSDELFLNTINEITMKIDSLGYDLNSLEISKSKEFVEKCVKQYK